MTLSEMREQVRREVWLGASPRDAAMAALKRSGWAKDPTKHANWVQLVSVGIKCRGEREALLPQDSDTLTLAGEGLGSLPRALVTARLLGAVRQERSRLWGHGEPFRRVHSPSLSALRRGLNSFEGWLRDSPYLLRQRVTVEFDAPGGPPSYPAPLPGSDALPGQTVETARVAHVARGQVHWRLAPFTRRGYAYTESMARLERLAMGFYSSPALAMYVVTGLLLEPGGLVVVRRAEGVSGQLLNTSFELRALDPNTPESLVSQAYSLARQSAAKAPFNEHFDLLRFGGRPYAQTFERLARLEARLILEEALRRVEAGEGVDPEAWDWRPDYRALKRGWQAYALELGLPGAPPQRQIFHRFKLEVPLAYYAPMLTEFLASRSV
jgi:hypothetical protein